MKYCSKCGRELLDEAVVCPGCGCMCEGSPLNTQAPTKENAVYAVLALVFGLLGGWLGLVFGIIGLKQYKEQSNRSMCIVGIVAWVVWLIVQIVIIAVGL